METSKSDTKQGKLKSDKVKMELTHFLKKEKLSLSPTALSSIQLPKKRV